MSIVQMPTDHDLWVQTNSYEEVTLTERSPLCEDLEKESTISSLDTTRLGCRDSTLLNRIGSDFQLHTTLAGTWSSSYNRSLHLPERGCVQFLYFYKELFLRKFDVKVFLNKVPPNHVKQDTLGLWLVQYTLVKLRNKLKLITQAKQHFPSCSMASRSTFRMCSWIHLQ